MDWRTYADRSFYDFAVAQKYVAQGSSIQIQVGIYQLHSLTE
jgi:hypothetical protein